MEAAGRPVCKWRCGMTARPRLLWLAGVLGLAVAAVALWSWRAREQDRALVDASDARLVALGRTVYVRECAACHGANLEGQASWRVRLPSGRMPAPPHDASGHTWHHSDQVLFDITKRGPAAYPSGYQTDMPAYAERLSDREIGAVISYIKSTWPKDILARQQRLSH